MSNAFDRMAIDYDEEFSHAMLGSLLRKRVWRIVDQCFTTGDQILELNCGTGEDALHLLQKGVHVHATDASEEMLQLVEKKSTSYFNLLQGPTAAGRLTYEQLDINNLGMWQPDTTFDGVLSNFGGLNCVNDLAPVAEQLHRVCKPDATVMLCIMGPYVPWEWLWYGLRGDFTKAFRRLSRSGVQWREMHICYPSLRKTKNLFSPYFHHKKTVGLGALLPPPYTEAWAKKHPAFIRGLNRLEQRLESTSLLTWLADHYLLIFSRKR